MFMVFGGFALLASGILANKIILQAMPPVLFVGVRMISAGLIILVINFNQFKKSGGFEKIYQDILPLFFIAFITTLIPSYLKAFGLQNMPSSKSTLLGSIDPFITAIYVYFLLGEKLSVRKIIGMIIGFVGIFVLVSSHTPLEEHLKAFSIFSYPELAAICSVMLSRFGWLMIQKLVRAERYSPMEINGISMLTSGVIALCAAPLFGECYLLPNVQIGKTAIAMAYTVICGNVIGYTLYGYALKHYSATLVSLSGFSIPIFVSIGAYLFLGEMITLYTACASLIMFAGIAIFHSND